MKHLKQKFLQFKIAVEQTIKDFKYNYKHVKLRAKKSNEIDYATLRVYCHILDKGLNNACFEKGHSLEYLDCAKKLRDKIGTVYNNDRCIRWVDEIIKRFEKAQEEGLPQLVKKNPVEYVEKDIILIRSFIKNRTSCRNFRLKSIASDILKQIVELAIEAPNGCCRQATRYYITQNLKIIKEASPHIAGLTNFSNIQCLVCVVVESNYYDLRDKNLQFVDTSLSAENFILAASLYGLYGTMCNFFHASSADISECKSLFHVDETENIVMFIAMGYPTTIPQKPERRNVEYFYKEI